MNNVTKFISRALILFCGIMTFPMCPIIGILVILLAITL